LLTLTAWTTPRWFFYVNKLGKIFFYYLVGFHAWSGKVGVDFLLLTMLTAIFTLGVEISGPRLGFFQSSLTVG